MKKVFLLLLTVLAVMSCSLPEDENPQYMIGPVEDVTMASAYKVDSISEIMVRYKRPNDSYIFQDFFYDAMNNTRTVAIEFIKLDRNNIVDDPTVYEVPLRFKPVHEGTYLFRFWDGTNTDGTQHYYEAEAIVEN